MNAPEQNNTPEEQVKTAAEMQQEALQAEADQAAVAEAEAGQQDEAMPDAGQLAEELAAAQAKAEENMELALRFKADMENQRRRFEKQVEDAHKYSVQKFAENLLPVIDSLEMGMQAEGSIEKIREGMDLTLKQFESVMEKFKLEAVGAVGDKFDPELHQAMSMQPSPEHENNTILAVMQKGYTLSGRTIRPAMVMVCKN
ncbi:MAG: nucleotide exchange factor GrpE [Thiolinea sp.]